MLRFLAALSIGLWAAAAFGQTKSDRPSAELTHEALRDLREGLIEAIGNADADAIVEYLDENVVVVWPDGQVTRKHEGVRSKLEESLTGADARLKSLTLHVETEERAILAGESMAVAFGSMNSHLVMRNGSKLDLPGAWSATLTKSGNRWRIASLHASTNLFDNPYIERAETTATWGGIIAGAVGAIVGAIASRLLARARMRRSKR